MVLSHEIESGGHALIIEALGPNGPEEIARLIGPADCWDFLAPMDSPYPEALSGQLATVLKGCEDLRAEWTTAEGSADSDRVVWSLVGVSWSPTDHPDSLGGLTWSELPESQQAAVVRNIAQSDTPTSALAALLIAGSPATSPIAMLELGQSGLLAVLGEYLSK